MKVIKKQKLRKRRGSLRIWKIKKRGYIGVLQFSAKRESGRS